MKKKDRQVKYVKSASSNSANALVKFKEKDGAEIRPATEPCTSMYRVRPFKYDKRKNIQEIVTRISLVLSEEYSNLLQRPVKLDAFDFMVADIVYTFSLISIDKPFSVYDVVSVIMGTDYPKNCSGVVKRVMKSLEKLRSILITIECDDEFKHRFKDKYDEIRKNERFAELEPGEKLCYVDQFLPIKVRAMKQKETEEGMVVTNILYNITDVPPLHQYSFDIGGFGEDHTSGQITTIPVALLAGPEGTRTEFEKVIIKYYLIKRIQQMKNPKAHYLSNIISLEPTDGGNKIGMLETLGYSAENYNNWPTKRAAIVKMFESALGELIQAGAIKGFEVRKGGSNGKKVLGFRIILNEESDG